MSPNEAVEIAALCRGHLLEEERLLGAALPAVLAIQQKLTQRQPGPFAQLAEEQQSLVQTIRDMHARRRALRDDLARRLLIIPSAVRLSKIFDRLPQETGDDLRSLLSRVRGMAEEFTATNRRLSVQLSIYLDAYQRLLRDLTGVGAGSGAMGRTARPMSLSIVL